MRNYFFCVWGKFYYIIHVDLEMRDGKRMGKLTSLQED